MSHVRVLLLLLTAVCLIHPWSHLSGVTQITDGVMRTDYLSDIRRSAKQRLNDCNHVSLINFALRQTI